MTTEKTFKVIKRRLHQVCINNKTTTKVLNEQNLTSFFSLLMAPQNQVVAVEQCC